MIKKYNVDEARLYSTPFGELPSVTTVLNLVKKVPGAWYSKMAVDYMRENVLDPLRSRKMSLGEFDKINLNELSKTAKATATRAYKEAGDIGSKVHAAIERYFKNIEKYAGETNEPVNIKPDSLLYELFDDPDVIKPFLAFVDWTNNNDVKCLLSEYTVYSKIGYAGTLDFIGTINGKVYLVDFKSSKGFWPEMPMQLAAYQYAHEEMTGDKVDGVGVLRLDKETGMPEWKEVPFDKLGYYMDKFLCLLAYWEHDHDGTEKWPRK